MAAGIHLTERAGNSHKGENGRVLLVGGSVDYAGAVYLAAMAALRSGADNVTIAAPEKVAWVLNALSPDFITVKFRGEYFNPSAAKKIVALSRGFDVLAVGNGIGARESTKRFAAEVIKKAKAFKVIDADAIKSISMDGCENSIITPHSKELGYFLINSNVNKSIINKIINEKLITKKSTIIKKIIQKFLDKNNIILLKGKIDAIISKDKIFYVKGGNAGMTKGGTGDVLAGLCAGFLAQSRDLLQSAINASYFNKKIGDILLRKKKGFTYLASDMVWEIERARINF